MSNSHQPNRPRTASLYTSIAYPFPILGQPCYYRTGGGRMSYKGFVGPVTATDPFYDSWCRARLSRILSNTKPNENGCLIWQGKPDRAGYARTTSWRGTPFVHRQAWLLSGYLIPADRELDHTCHQRNCINVNHLRCVSHQENMSNRKVNRSQVCHLGHTKKLTPRGVMVCYTCLRAAVKRWQARNPEQQREIWRRARRGGRTSDKKMEEQQVKA